MAVFVIVVAFVDVKSFSVVLRLVTVAVFVIVTGVCVMEMMSFSVVRKLVTVTVVGVMVVLAVIVVGTLEV